MTIKLSSNVTIRKSRRDGTVEAIAQYTKGLPNLYFVEFLNGIGDVVSEWFREDDLILLD